MQQANQGNTSLSDVATLFLASPCLVGSPEMLNQLFESLREWVEVTRRSKDSKKPLGRDSFKGARVIWGGGSRPGSASGEIIPCLEQS